MAIFKIPRYVRFVTEFPLSPTGKVVKLELRKSSNELLKSNTNDMFDNKINRKQKEKL